MYQYIYRKPLCSGGYTPKSVLYYLVLCGNLNDMWAKRFAVLQAALRDHHTQQKDRAMMQQFLPAFCCFASRRVMAAY